MAVQDYKINYKSDFVLTINGDAGWAIPFCIKFWTGMPSQAYFVGFDGVKYVNCRVGDTPTQLLVMFDDHHLPIGPLRMQIAYHTTIEEFPGSVFDEVTNARDVIVTIDGTDYQVLLDFTGEDAPELEFNLPAYANEAERIQNELQRQQNEADRIAAELQREQATAAAVQGAENVNAQLNGTTLTVTNRQGVSTSVNTKGEQGVPGPVGPEGPQGEQGAKGEKGDTGATGPQGVQGPAGPQGQTGVSITDFVKTGETETDTLYDIEFSDDTTKPVAIPKGEKGDQGEQGPEGPQGPMGDVAVITPEQQAAFTMYSETGQNTNGPMTQKAVTDALNNIAASGVSYDNSQSGLASNNVQGALDEVSGILSIDGDVVTTSTWGNSKGIGSDGTLKNKSNAGYVTYVDCSGHKSIKIKEPKLGTKQVGIAFYTGQDQSTFIAGSFHAFTVSGGDDNYIWSEYSIPEGANYVRWTTFKSTNEGYFEPQYLFSENTENIVKDLVSTTAELEEEAEEHSQKIENLDTYTVGTPIEPVMTDGSCVRVTGGTGSESYLSASGYINISGANYIRISKALIGSSLYGMAFYPYPSQTSAISGIAFTEYDSVLTNQVVDIPVPEGANWFRFTAYATSNDRYFTPWYSLIYGSATLFKDAASSQVATQIMRSCKSISQGVLPNNLVTRFAFSANMLIESPYAYVSYIASNTLNGDTSSQTDTVKPFVTKVSIETNEIVDTVEQSVIAFRDEDGNEVFDNYSFGAYVPVKNVSGEVIKFGQMSITDTNNPIMATSGLIQASSYATTNAQMCKLTYTANGVVNTVRFSVANYRQMLVDMGYVSTYHAPAYDTYDNNCIMYDSASGKYYDLICTVAGSGFNLPLILLESDDTYTWSLKSRIGDAMWTASEIKGVIKDGKIYAAIRQRKDTNALSWVVYDIENAEIISSGTFNSGYTVSRPYVFIFNGDVYMVINVEPSVYGYIANMVSHDDDSRSEVNIYKMVDDTPVFMRKVCNPTGLNYHCWEEVPPYTAPNKTSPMTAYGAVYCAFSEDRRLLFRRMFSQVSFGDVTALFAESGRVI